MTTLITRTCSSNEHYNGDGDLVVITITPEDAKRYLDLIDQFCALRDSGLGTSLYKLVLWNNDVDYVRGGVDDEYEEEVWDDQADPLDDSDPRIAEYKGGAVRVECSTVSICADRVYWQTIVKHSSVRLESGSVTYATLKEIAEGGKA
jgi:hypothetical protein